MGPNYGPSPCSVCIGPTPVGITALGALDDFSDTLHDEIIVQARAAGLMVELLDAKGEILLE